MSSGLGRFSGGGVILSDSACRFSGRLSSSALFLGILGIRLLAAPLVRSLSPAAGAAAAGTGLGSRENWGLGWRSSFPLDSFDSAASDLASGTVCSSCLFPRCTRGSFFLGLGFFLDLSLALREELPFRELLLSRLDLSLSWLELFLSLLDLSPLLLLLFFSALSWLELLLESDLLDDFLLGDLLLLLLLPLLLSECLLELLTPDPELLLPLAFAEDDEVLFAVAVEAATEEEELFLAASFSCFLRRLGSLLSALDSRLAVGTS